MKRPSRLLVGGLAGILALAPCAGCYSARPLIEIPHQQCSLRYDEKNVRIGVEVIDSGSEAYKMLGYPITNKNFLGAFMRIENQSETDVLSVERKNMMFQDRNGYDWTQVEGGAVAGAFANTEAGIAGATIGASLGLLAPLLMWAFVPAIRNDFNRKVNDFNSKTLPPKQELYPQGTACGCVFFSKPKEVRGGFEANLVGGRLVIPYEISTQDGTRTMDKATFTLEKPDNYFDRIKK